MSELETEPRRPEPTSTVLARIEGIVRLLDFKVDDVKEQIRTLVGRVDRHDDELESIRLAMQRLGDEAKARAAADAAAISAVRTARADEREASDRRWTPAARWVVAISCLASVVLAVVAMLK